MLDYICYFTIHRKSWTDSSWHKNSIHCRYQLIHVYASSIFGHQLREKGRNRWYIVWCNRKFVVVTTQLTNEFQVAVNLLRKWSHVTTKCGKKQKNWPTAQSSGHNSQTFVHVWNWYWLVGMLSGCQIHVASHELQTTTHTWRSWFFQI